nr:ABC transporter ATP-binding protein [uncultured Draconibacterium sp.]
MGEHNFIIRSLGLFLKYSPAKIILLFLITLLQGFTQGITVVLLIPMLGLLTPTSAGDQPSWATALNSIFSRMGIELNLEAVLIIFTSGLLFVAVLSYFQSVWQSVYQQDFSYSIRKRLFKKIILSDWAFLNGKSKHNHIQVLTTEIPKMTTYYYFYLSLAGKIIFIAAHVILALAISVSFSLIVIAIGIVVFFFLRKYLKKAKWLGSANVQAFRHMLKRIDEFWLTVKIAKVHHSERFYYEKFEETNSQMLYYQNKQVRNRAFPQLMFTLAGVLALVALVYLSYQIIHLPLASLFVLILLFSRIYPKFTGLNNDLNLMLSNVGSVKLVLETEKELKNGCFCEINKSEAISLTNYLDIKDLSFGYESGHLLFDHFSERIPAGKITGIVGESGCGKTTLLDLVAGLFEPENGTIAVDGKPLTLEDLPAWKNKLGYLPQDPFFIDGTLRENLIWDSKEELSDARIMDVLHQVNAPDLINRQKQGLDTYLVNYQYHFSGGERQRLALARVLLRNPDMLLLDEATSALDPENEILLMACLKRMRHKVTIIFVTHRESLYPYFDKIISLNR